MQIKIGGTDDAKLMLLPLKEAAAQIAKDMHAAGTGKRCGVCGKPFSTARKWRGVARLTYGDKRGGVMMVAWLLCGRCNHEAQQHGGKVPECLRREAESLLDAAQLAMSEPAGTA